MDPTTDTRASRPRSSTPYSPWCGMSIWAHPPPCARQRRPSVADLAQISRIVAQEFEQTAVQRAAAQLATVQERRLGSRSGF